MRIISSKILWEVTEGVNGRKECVGGESIVFVAYDVPILVYWTKPTINIRLWLRKQASYKSF